MQRLLDRHYDSGSPAQRQLCIAAELQGVAKALFPVQKKRLAADVLVTEPKRLRKRSSADGFIKFFPPLVLQPTFLDASDFKQALAAIVVCAGIVRLEG